MKCLDSTFLIDLLKNDTSTVRKAKEMEKTSLLASTEINVFEIASGIEQSKLSDLKKEQKIAESESLFKRLHVFPLNREGAIRAARIIGELRKKGSPTDTLDALVAGISLANGCDVVVSRNEKHFEHIEGLIVESY